MISWRRRVLQTAGWPDSQIGRIFITGNAGSGKSTLAREIGQLLSIPVFGLDQVVWQSGWRKTPPPERDQALSQLAAGATWVIEGVSKIIEAQADLVIFLDVHPSLCAWRCAQRNLPYLFRSRPGLPPSCPELLIVPQLLKMIWRFNTAVRPGILQRAAHPQPGQLYRQVSSRSARTSLLTAIRKLRQ